LAACRIRGTRVALLRYVRHLLLEGRGLAPAVASVRAKVLQLHGTVDEEVPFSAAERLQTQLRDSRLVPIEGASHFLMFGAPERFASEVEAFLPTM
jgi:pimeloyl-ACP methyl ester carboxylesterase